MASMEDIGPGQLDELRQTTNRHGAGDGGRCARKEEALEEEEWPTVPRFPSLFTAATTGEHAQDAQGVQTETKFVSKALVATADEEQKQSKSARGTAGGTETRATRNGPIRDGKLPMSLNDDGCASPC